MSDNKHLVPTCIIYVDGVRLSTACEGAFRSVKVFDVMNKISECFISFDRQDLGDENAKDFPFNANVSVHLGYKDDVNEVFNGEITAQKISHSQYSPSMYTVKVSSLLHHLNHGMHKRTFENKTPSQGIKDILSRYNLQADSARHDFLVTDTGHVLTSAAVQITLLFYYKIRVNCIFVLFGREIGSFAVYPIKFVMFVFCSYTE
jgi:phage protein D